MIAFCPLLHKIIETGLKHDFSTTCTGLAYSLHLVCSFKCQFTHPSIYLSIHASIHLSTPKSLSVCLSVCLSVNRSVHLSVSYCMFVCHSAVCLSRSVCPLSTKKGMTTTRNSGFLPSLSVCLSVCQSVSLSAVSLCVLLCVCHSDCLPAQICLSACYPRQKDYNH